MTANLKRSTFPYSLFFFATFLICISLPLNRMLAQVIINEVMVNPQTDASAPQFQSLKVCSQPTFGREYIELYNANPCDSVDISCFLIGFNSSFTAQVNGTFRFPSGTKIGPLDFLSIGGPNTGANIIINNFCSNPHLNTGNDRWFLPNGDGYLILWNSTGTPVDAVYWTTAAGQANKWGTDSDIQLAPTFIAAGVSCPAVASLTGPSGIPVASPIVHYAGVSPSLGNVIHRTVDGATTWATNATPSINACNGACVVSSPVNIAVTAVNNTQCNLPNGSIDITPSGATSPYTFAWSNGLTTEDISALAEGIYQVTVTSANNCSATSSITVTGSTAVSISSSSINASCGANNGSINLTINGATSPYTYIWSDASTNEDLTGLGTGTYTVTVSSSNSCTATLSVPISSSAGFTIVPNTTNVTCDGGSNGAISITITGGTSPFNYSWSNGLTTEDVTGLTAGTYSFTSTDANGCSGTVSGLQVTQPASVAATITITDASCAGNDAAVDITVTGGTAPYTFLWNNGRTTEDISALTAGPYTVTITDFNSCQITLSGTAIRARSVGALGAITNITCEVPLTGAIALTVSGGIPPYSFQWSNGETNQDIINLSAGSYTVTTTSSNGCSATSSFTVNATTSVTISSAVTNTSCGLINGAIDLTPSGSTAPYTFAWNNGLTTEDIDALAPGNYSVTVTSDVNCTATSSFTVTASTAVSISSAVTNTSCGLNNGIINLTPSGATSPYTFSWSNGSTTEDISALAPGTYSVTVTSANNCTATSSITVSGSSAATISSAVTNASCGQNNGSINITPSGATSPYTFAWSNGRTTQNNTGLAAGTFRVTVTSADNCTATASITVTASSAVSISSAVTNARCGLSNGAINLTPSGSTSPYTFTWSNGSTTEDISALAAGTFRVTVTSAENCTATSSITVTASSAVSISSTVATSCGVNSGSISLTPSGATSPYTFAWSNGRTTQNNTGLAAGTYTVTVTSANSCTATSSITVTGSSAVTISSAVTNTSCGLNNGSINITPSGSTSPYNFAWSNGRTTQNNTGLAAGTFRVTVTSADNCTAIASITVTGSTAVSITSAVTNANCGLNIGSINITPSGSVSPYTFTWSNGSTTEDISALTVGTFRVTVTSANSCTATASITVTGSTAVTISSTITNANCGLNNGSISLTPTGATSPYTFAWSNGRTTQNNTGLAAGTYNVTVTSANSCTATSSITVTGATAVTITSAVTDASCELNNGSINLTPSGSTSPYTFAWSNGRTTQNNTGILAGTYTVTVTSANSCTATASITVTGSSAVTLSTSSFNASCNAINGSINLTVSGSNAPYSFVWNNTATTEDLTGLAAGSYTVTVTSSNSCTATATTIITASSGLAIVPNPTNVTCNGLTNGIAAVNVSGGTGTFTYNWSTGATTDAISALAPGTYTVTVNSGSSSSSTDTLYLQDFSGVHGWTLNVSTGTNGADNNFWVVNDNEGGILPNGCGVASNGNNTMHITSVFFPAGGAAYDAGGLCGILFCPETNRRSESPIFSTVGRSNLTLSFNFISNGQALLDNASVLFNSGSGWTTLAPSIKSPICVGGQGQWTAFTFALPASCDNNPNVQVGFNWTNNDDGLGSDPSVAIDNILVTSPGTGSVCTGTQSVTITEPSAISATVTVTNASCAGNDGAVANTVSGGTSPYTFNWNNGSTTEDISALTAGVYSVTITDLNNCTATAAMTVSAASTVTISSTVINTNCGLNNGSINLTPSGATSPYTFAWSNGRTTQNNTGLAAGTYNVTVTSANNCTATSSITVSGSTAVTISSAVTNASCGINNGLINITPSGATSPYTFAWNNGRTTQNNTGLAAGTFRVTVTSANGCTATTSFVVTASAALTVSSTFINTRCGLNNGSINLTPSGATSPYTFAWSNGRTTQNNTGLAAGTYTVTVTSANSCTATSSITVTGSSAVTISSAVTDASCSLSNGFINLTPSGATSPYTFAWSNGRTTQNNTGLAAGTFNVTVTSANSCTATSSITITGSTAVSISSAVTNTSCGLINGSINLTPSGSSSPYTFVWSDGSTTEDISALAAGTYAVTVTSANNCTATFSTTISGSTAVTISSAVTNESCGLSNGSINLTPSGATSPYTFAWSNGRTTQNNTGLAAGSYTVTVTSANSCTATSSITVTGSTAVTISSAVTSESCGLNNASIDLTASGSASPYTFIWSNGSTSEDISALAVGAYTVTVTSANNCTATSSITVTGTSAVTISSAVTNATCGLNNGSVNLTPSGASSPYTFAWSNSSTTEDISALAAGSYNVTVTSANSCTATSSITVTGSSAVSISSAVTNESCGLPNGSINITPSGATSPYTFAWSNGLTTEDISALAAGVYQVTVTSANNCSATSSITVTGSTAVSISSSSINASCGANNGSINLTTSGATSPYTYIWSDASTTEDLTGLGTGTYTVTVSSSNSCTATLSVNITASAGLSLNSSSTNAVCVSSNGSINLSVSGGTAPYNFSWSNGGTTEDISGLAAGNYIVTVTDLNACSSTFSTTVSASPCGSVCNPAGNLIIYSNYDGGILTINVDQNIPNLIIGINSYEPIQVTITGPFASNVTEVLYAGMNSNQNNNNCNQGNFPTSITGVSSSIITINPPMTPPLVGYVPQHGNGAGPWGALMLGTAGNCDTTTNAGGGNTPDEIVFHFQTQTGGTLLYHLTQYNCWTNQTLNVSAGGNCCILPPNISGCPTINLSPTITNVSCNGGSNGTISITTTGGASPFNYSWSNGRTTEDITGLIAGIYSLTATDANGCTGTVSGLTVTQPTAVLATVTVTDATCAGNDAAVAITVSGGTTPYTFLWSNGLTTEDISALAAGNYTVTITDFNNCQITASGTALSSSSVSVTGTITNLTCGAPLSGAISLSVSGGTTPYTFLWSNGETIQNINNLSVGSYTVTVSDALNCRNISTYNLVQSNQPIVSITNDTLYNGQPVTCNGICDAAFTATAAGGTPGYSFLWNTGANTASLSNQCPGIYTVTVTDAGGCTQNSAITISQPATLSTSVSSQINIGCSGDSTGAFTVSAVGGTPGYTFNIGNGPVSSNLFNNLPAGNYCVTVSDLNFCQTFVCTTITQPSTTVSATASVTQQVSCNNGCNGAAAVTATGGTAPYTFLWSANSQTTQTATGLCGGSSHSVRVRDANGCEFTATVSLPNPTVLTASLTGTANANCNGGTNGTATITASGGTAPYTFSLGTPQATGNFTGLAAGNYVVTVTDNRGCTTTVPFVITAPPALNITSISITSNYNGSQISCAGACDGAATVVAAGGTGTYTFQWSNGQTTFTTTGLCNNGASVTVTDQNGCRASGAILGTLTEPSAISLTLSNQINIGCAGATTGSFTVTAAGGTPNYSFFNGSTTQANGSYSNLAAGSYCVTVTDLNGCRSSICTNLSQGSPVSVTATVVSNNNGNAISCSNSADGSALATAAGGTAPYSFVWSNGQSTALATGLAAGQYCVTVTDVNLCAQTACVTISGPSVLNVSAVSGTVNNASCFGIADGSFTIVATGGTAPYIYSINNGVTFTNQVTYNNQPAGTATIIVRDANGCQDTTTVTITQPSQLNVLLVNETDVTCFGSNNGSVTVTGTGGTAPYTYSFQGGAFTATSNFVDLIAGNYTVVTQDANGCTASIPVVISQPSATVLSVITQVNPTCNLACDGQIVVNATGGTAPYTYSSDGNSFQVSGAFSSLCEGTYPMTVEDAQGCLTVRNVTLTDPSPVAVTVTQTQTVSCFGGNDGEATAVAVGGTGAFTYNWQPGGQTTAIATGLTAQAYSVTATDANGCATVGTVTVTQPAALVANITAQSNPTCFGQTNGSFSVQADPLTGTGPYTYSIGGAAQAGGLFSNLGAGNYTVTVSDANGCTAVVPVVLTEPAVVNAPTIQITSNYNGANISCANACDGAVNLPSTTTGGTTPYSFLWSNSETTQSISGLCAGTYRVTITDANGCRDTTSITLTAPTQLTATAAVTGAGCSGGTSGDITVTAGGGTAPYSFSLNGGAAQFGNVFSNLTAGTYTVVTTDANGCTVSNTAVIGSAAAIVINANATSNFAGFNVSCFGSSNATATVAAAGGVAPYSFAWSNGQTTQLASGLAAGAVTVTVTDANGCQNTATVSITQPTEVTVTTVSSIDPTCGGGAGTGSVTVSAAGGAGTYVYSINSGAFQSGTTFNNLGATTHIIIVQDANGCRDTTDITLTAPDTLRVTVDATNLSCFSLNDGNATAVVTGGTSFPNGGFIFNWSPGGQSTQTIGNLAGNITYTVTVQDANGCVAFGSAFIIRPTQLVATVQNITNVDCNGNGNGSVTLAVTGASGVYQFSTDGGVTFQNAAGSPIVISGLAGGTYQLVVRDSASQSCEVPITVEVLENNGLIVAVTTTAVGCLNNTDGTATAIPSGGEGPYSYAWSNGQNTATATGLASNFQDSVFTGAPYTVTVTDQNGCSASAGNIGVTSPSELVARDSVLSNVSCFAGNDGEATILVSGGNSAAGFSVLWSNGATTATQSGLEAFIYSVIVRDNNGCTDTITVSITEPLAPLTAALSTDSVTCFGGSNGIIVIDSVNGGTPAYEYAFDENGPFGPAEILSAGLPAGLYTVYVRDSNGCIITVNDLLIFQPGEVDVIAYEDQTIRMGQTVSVSATVNSTQVDTSLVSWYFYNTEGVQTVLCEGGNCFEIDVNDIFETTTLVFNLNNGCNDTATVTITVNTIESVFVPNAFTPNGDGVNDVFTIYGSTDVQRVERLLVFDRWGELVYEATDFAPNDLANGWDGSFKSKKLNPAVFVYYAEITLVNGETVTRKGDVTLIR